MQLTALAVVRQTALGFQVEARAFLPQLAIPWLPGFQGAMLPLSPQVSGHAVALPPLPRLLIELKSFGVRLGVVSGPHCLDTGRTWQNPTSETTKASIQLPKLFGPIASGWGWGCE